MISNICKLMATICVCMCVRGGVHMVIPSGQQHKLLADPDSFYHVEYIAKFLLASSLQLVVKCIMLHIVIRFD